MQKENIIYEAIMSTGRLFVRNLVFSCTEDELRRRFDEYGPVDQVRAQTCAKSRPERSLEDDK